jgi:hypothetical protein
VGVVPAQYQLLVDLFESLGERKELFGSLGLDRHAMRLTSLMLLLPGALFALLAFAPSPLGSYNLTVLALSSFVLLLLVVMEAANSFFNPVEVAVLAHQPIESSTYLAAKTSYLVAVVLRAEMALNGPAALAGLVKDDARWFYPFTHLTAAVGAGIFTALATCAAFGVLFRWVPASRVRSVALWLQILVVASPMLWNLAARRVREAGIWTAWRAAGMDWSFVPLTWFNAIAVAGQAAPAVPLRWGAPVGALVSAILIAYGVASLSARYMTRISGVLRSARRTRRGRRRASLGGRLTRLLSGTAAGQAAWQFLHPMMRRDWQFRRAAVQLLVLFVLAGPAVILSARRASPFGDNRPAFIGILPELLSLLTLGLVQLLPFSASTGRSGFPSSRRRLPPWRLATPGTGESGMRRCSRPTAWPCHRSCWRRSSSSLRVFPSARLRARNGRTRFSPSSFSVPSSSGSRGFCRRTFSFAAAGGRWRPR